MAMGPELNLYIAEKRFPGADFPLLREFRLDVVPGEVVALVGPSGVGKSSLLRMIAGVDRDYSGRIAIGGKEARDAPPAGFVFQDSRLLPWLTAADNIRAVRPETTRAEAVELLERVGLSGIDRAFPRQLSGGMQRRVALARALSVNPGLLLLDEPFVSLDRNLIRELQKVFTDVIEATRPTVVMVTHMPEDAAMLADRAIVMAGRPARIEEDIAFETPRAARTAAVVLEMTQSLGAHSSPGAG